MSENGTTAMDGFRVAQSILQSRAELAAHLGKAFGGARDYYEVLGYKKQIHLLDYRARYEREGIASRVNNVYADETWRLRPDVYENQDEVDTEFEIAWKNLVDRINIFHYLHRLDRLAGLGRYGVLLFGFADGSALDQPVGSSGENALRYLALYSEEHAEVSEIDNETRSPRFGLPLKYELDLSRSTVLSNRQQVLRESKDKDIQIVHHSRILHVAEGLLEDDVYGSPRLRDIYNYLDDLIKVTGGAPEAFWRNASRDLIAALRSDAHVSDQDLTQISDHLDEFVHGLRRILKVEGMDVTSLAPEIASPKETFDMLIDLIAATKSIPKRILMGSERGELSSGQDVVHFTDQVVARQEEFVESVILRPFIDRLMTYRILPVPRDGYTVEWQPLLTETQEEKSERILKSVQALQTVAGQGQVLTVFPLEEVRETVLDMDRVSPYETDEDLAFEEEIDDDDLEDEPNDGSI